MTGTMRTNNALKIPVRYKDMCFCADTNVTHRGQAVINQWMTAWVNSFWQCNMKKLVIRTTVGDPRQKHWQILISNNQVIFQVLET